MHVPERLAHQLAVRQAREASAHKPDQPPGGKVQPDSDEHLQEQAGRGRLLQEQDGAHTLVFGLRQCFQEFGYRQRVTQVFE